MIELAILGLLDEAELHGYELRKRLTELPGNRLAVSFGSLYPALNRLEKAGLVKAVSDSAVVPLAPMSGSLVGELAAFRARHRATNPERGTASRSGGRAKKVYGITESGRRRLHDLILEPATGDDRAFALRVAFCQHLTPAERIALFEGRRAELTRRRDQRRPGPATPGAAGRLNTYLRSVVERDHEALDADIAWLDRLIAAERAAAAPASAPVADTPTDSAVGTPTDSGGHL
jgi:DNA-binding PadR family transcriptional regulator